MEELPNGNEFPFDLLQGHPARTVLWVINRNENLTHYITESKVSSSQPTIRAAQTPACRALCLDMGTLLQSQGISWCSQRLSWVLLAPEESGIPLPFHSSGQQGRGKQWPSSTWNWENSIPRLCLALERHQGLSGGKCSQAQRGTEGHPTSSPLPELCPSALRVTDTAGWGRRVLGSVRTVGLEIWARAVWNVFSWYRGGWTCHRRCSAVP